MEKLSLRLRQETMKQHQDAEGSSILSLLFAKKLEKERYRNYIRALHEVYRSLEDALRDERAEVVKGLRFPELYRVSSLEKDLICFAGADWKSLPVAKAGLRHADHVRKLLETAPHRVAGHAYVRYLGDLSGGQMIGKSVAEAYGPEGTAFYHFTEVSDAMAMKQRFRDALDQLPLNERQQQEVIDEACHTFNLTGALLREL